MRIAIIGGIGSGKSEVMKIAKEAGFECVSADEINAELLRTPSYIAKIALQFPAVVKDGAVDKKTLASIVFADEGKRQILNSIAHPEIMAKIRAFDAPHVAVELPLYIEGGERDFDEVVLVKTPMCLRIKRLEKRGLAKKDAIARKKSQPSDRTLKKYATRVLHNGGSIEKLKKRALRTFDDILKNAEMH